MSKVFCKDNETIITIYTMHGGVAHIVIISYELFHCSERSKGQVRSGGC